MALVLPEVFQSGIRMFRGETFTNMVLRLNAAFGGTSRSVLGVATYTQIQPKLTATDAITAGVGGTQANAVLLPSAINRVSTVTSANDSVKLPLSVGGESVVVINGAGANSMQVFGSGTDTINDVATATGVAQAAGKTATYSCPVAGKWYRNLSA